MHTAFRTLALAFICAFCFNGCLLSSSQENTNISRGYPFSLKTNDQIPDGIQSKAQLINLYGKPDLTFSESGYEHLEYKRTITRKSSGSYGCMLVTYNRDKTITETTRFTLKNDAVVSVSVDEVER
jgi:hypothetical protein